MPVPGSTDLPKSDVWICKTCRSLLLTEPGHAPGSGGTEFPDGLEDCPTIQARRVLES